MMHRQHHAVADRKLWGTRLLGSLDGCGSPGLELDAQEVALRLVWCCDATTGSHRVLNDGGLDGFRRRRLRLLKPGQDLRVLAAWPQ
ncbi:hypothetical protein HMPREF2990_11745 [Corynebacterium sp. HMSC071B10]|nr:hypothetical protein HMPREF2990_11745 [Corynebacterium sp. HMSC071B10]